MPAEFKSGRRAFLSIPIGAPDFKSSGSIAREENSDISSSIVTRDIESLRAVREAVGRNCRSSHRSLPVAASFQVPTPALTGGANQKFLGKQWTAEFLIEGIRKGRSILPTISWVAERNQFLSPALYRANLDSTFDDPIKFLSARKLPISIATTQLTDVLRNMSQHEGRGNVRNDPFVTRIDGTTLGAGLIDPLSPVALWRRAARVYMDSRADPFSNAKGSEAPGRILAEIAKLYPDPPVVYCVFNNEDRILQPAHFANNSVLNYSKDWRRGVAKYGSLMTVNQVYKAIDDGYRERFQILFTEARSLAQSIFPKSEIVLVGYANPLYYGGFEDWRSHTTLYFDRGAIRGNGRMNGLDGACLSAYPMRNFSDTTVRSVFSNADVGHWIYTLLARDRGPLPSELAVHDTSEYGADAFEHSPFTPSRYKGMIRHLLWLTRPRIIREWRSSVSRRSDLGNDGASKREHYWAALVDACSEIGEVPILAKFWRSSEVVRNSEVSHPYALQLLGASAEMYRRWPYTETSVDPLEWKQRSMRLDDKVNTWVLTSILRESEKDSYLVFAQSPEGKVSQLDIRIRTAVDKYLIATISSSVEGIFWLVEESGLVTKVLQ